ncbi:MAG: efflux RND transporter periplasmic adaptor subunit, partial [Pirellulaceae bacterium]
MNQDEPIKPDEADVDDQVSNVDADAPTDSEPVETATEATIPPVEAQPSVPQSGGGMKWLMRTGVQAATIVTVAGLVFFLLGIAQRTKWLTADGFSGSKGEAVAEAGGGEDKRYICPMMCTPPSTEPGRCPVCAMELVEATGGGGGDGISVTIEASARRLVGIQTAMSTMGEVNRTIRTIGSIDFDESQLSTISAYIDGRLEKMYANYAGVKVNEGDDLALIYSPQL